MGFGGVWRVGGLARTLAISMVGDGITPRSLNSSIVDQHIHHRFLVFERRDNLPDTIFRPQIALYTTPEAHQRSDGQILLP